MRAGHRQNGEHWFWRWGVPLLAAVIVATAILVLLLAVITASKDGAFDGI